MLDALCCAHATHDTATQIDGADGRHEHAHLRHDGDERHLLHVHGLAAAVGPCDHLEALVGAQNHVVGDERPREARSSGLGTRGENGVAPLDDDEGASIRELWSAVGLRAAAHHLGKSSQHVEEGHTISHSKEGC